MATGPRPDQIQGDVTLGFRKDYQAFVLVRFSDGAAGRRWLAGLLPDIASAEEIAAFKRLFKLVRRRQPRPEVRVIRATWVNVALSWPGLERLGAQGIGAFPREFREGLYRRAEELGDGDAATIAAWEVGGSCETEAHAIVLLGADVAADLDCELERQRARLGSFGLEELRTYRGQTLEGELRGHEHFGFRDGASQPHIDHLLDGSEATIPPVGVGEFILGYPDGRADAPPEAPPWARDGSYLVFRRLRQDVAAFHRTARREAASVGLSPEQLAAKLVGRWPSGAKLGNPIELGDPGWVDDRAARLEADDFANDPRGERFPRFAHVRKAHPRDLVASGIPPRRLIRRGIPYGPALPPDVEDDGRDRGLLFLAYQSSIARQFEGLQRRWLGNPDFPRPRDGADPLADRGQGHHDVSFPMKGGRVRLRLDRFVSATAGGYFFAPSIGALADLANREVGWHGEGTNVATAPYRPETGEPAAGEGDARGSGDFYRELGELIRRHNPYGYMGRSRDGSAETAELETDGLAKDFNAEQPFPLTEEDMDKARQLECVWWYFQGEPRRVTKAIRVPYTYTHPRDGLAEEVDEHILIGFEGVGH